MLQTEPNVTHSAAQAAQAAQTAQAQSEQTKRPRTQREWAIDARFLEAMLASKVERFWTAGEVIFTAERENKVIDVFKGMVEHKFHSVPVLAKTEHRYYGFITQFDIVREVVHRFNKESMRETKAFWERMDAIKAIGELKVTEIMQHPLTLKNVFHPVYRGYSMLYAIELMAREPLLERVPVLDEGRHLINLITQSKVISHIADHIDLLGDKAAKPLHLCLGMFKPLVTCHLDTIAIDAFERMVANGVQGIAVVDSETHLLDTLTMADLKVCGSKLNYFWRFYQPVETYISELKREFSRAPNVMVITPDRTLGEALQILAKNHLHRLFIVESPTTMKVKGVVALKDLLLELITMG